MVLFMYLLSNMAILDIDAKFQGGTPIFKQLYFQHIAQDQRSPANTPQGCPNLRSIINNPILQGICELQSSHINHWCVNINIYYIFQIKLHNILYTPIISPFGTCKFFIAISVSLAPSPEAPGGRKRCWLVGWRRCAVATESLGCRRPRWKRIPWWLRGNQPTPRKVPPQK